jgi:hypothetical protein
MDMAFLVLLGAWLAGCVSPDADGLHRLVAAYPEALAVSDKPNLLVWKDGAEMAYDDGIVKESFEAVLEKASPKDQMSQPYPCGRPVSPPEKDCDPGRIRCAAFFAKMYGGSAKSVEQSLTPVAWPAAGKNATVQFSKINHAAEALEAVGKEIEALPPEVKRYVAHPAGTFYWRPVRGERRLSPHSYGIAIDFQLPDPLYRYWRWDTKDAAGEPVYPREVLSDETLGRIVGIFERHGFIWGGKWYHYDTMHFEYRPELTNQATEALPKAASKAL